MMHDRDRWSGLLQIAQAGVPAPDVDYVTILSDGLYIFPRDRDLYPLTDWGQIILYWGLWKMPDQATFVDVQLFGFRAELNDPTGAVESELGALAKGQERLEIYGEVFEVRDPVLNIVTVHPARIRKTVADTDPAAITPPFTPSAPFNVQQYTEATRHSFPIREDRLGFRVTHDGVNSTGSFTLYATLGE